MRLVGGRDLAEAYRQPAISAFGVVLFLTILAGLAAGWMMPDRFQAPALTRSEAMQTMSAHFSLCHSGGGINCVVDGDTFYLRGEKIRIADIDAPETHPSRCELEADLGERATLRLQSLLNAGPVALNANAGRDRDPYGRLLRTVERNGQSLGGALVNEGLARWYEGGRRPWC